MNDIVVDWVVDTMKWLVKTAKDDYACNRHPKVAGALLIPVHNDSKSIFAGVHSAFYGNTIPAIEDTCKKVGCDIEYTVLPEDILDARAGLVNAFHTHCVRTVHAEQRAIDIAARDGVPIDGATLFSVLRPCYQCSKHIVVAGIRKIYFAGTVYNEERTRKLLRENGVECTFIEAGLEY